MTEQTDTTTERTDTTTEQSDATTEQTETECEYCARTFRRERYLALHRGLRHRDALSDGETAAFRDAREAERRGLRRFRLKALVAIVVLYFGLLMAYAVFA